MVLNYLKKQISSKLKNKLAVSQKQINSKLKNKLTVRSNMLNFIPQTRKFQKLKNGIFQKIRYMKLIMIGRSGKFL